MLLSVTREGGNRLDIPVASINGIEKVQHYSVIHTQDDSFRVIEEYRWLITELDRKLTALACQRLEALEKDLTFRQEMKKAFERAQHRGDREEYLISEYQQLLHATRTRVLQAREIEQNQIRAMQALRQAQHEFYNPYMQNFEYTKNLQNQFRQQYTISESERSFFRELFERAAQNLKREQKNDRSNFLIADYSKKESDKDKD